MKPDSQCFAMAAVGGDYDNDDDLDLFATSDDNQNNFLYQNNGDGSFIKITSGTIIKEDDNGNDSCLFSLFCFCANIVCPEITVSRGNQKIRRERLERISRCHRAMEEEHQAQHSLGLRFAGAPDLFGQYAGVFV
jgi:hypothetical protein